jgi:hypothetical protein
VTEIFDLKEVLPTFDFVFRLYNFVSLADEDNRTLRDPLHILGKLHADVSHMDLLGLTSTLKRKTTDNDTADTGSSKRPRNGGRRGNLDSDILSDVEALKHAGYTIPPEVEGFKSLLPVRVSFP